jgi:hypothetical protein
MTGKEFLYNDFRDYLKEKVFGFLANLVSSVGDTFLNNLTSIIFPFSSKVLHALNDAHNRGEAAPEQQFSGFFCMKVYFQKTDRPNFTHAFQQIHDVWIATHAILKKGN